MRKDRAIYFLSTKPVFLFLLPVFFVLHGFTENYGLVPLKDALLLLLVYTAGALSIAGVSWLFYRDFKKASLIAFLLTGYHFLFGSMQDLLRHYFPGAFIARYSFILPASFLFFSFMIIWLKKRKPPQSVLIYLNFLLFLLLLIDTGWLAARIVSKKERSSRSIAGFPFTKCDTCKRPDIFFIVLDGYSGNTALKQQFGFDNTAFENELRDRNFYVINNSRSNYNYTPFSMASMLNMDYLDLDMKTKGQGNLSYCYRMIRNSRMIKFLEAHDYKLYNNSFFDFESQPAMNNNSFLPARTGLITSQTFLGRVWKDILFNVATGKLGIKSIEKKIVYSQLHTNHDFTRLTLGIAAQKTASPKFVYTHLMMPHYPYYFDSEGKALPFDSLVEGRQQSKQNYVGYLRYCNKKILQLTDAILETSSAPPVIILTGDHGFRYFQRKENRKYCFMTLAAVYLPTGDYSGFHSDISGVNLFPALLNTQFRQHIPLQKDSTIYLWE